MVIDMRDKNRLLYDLCMRGFESSRVKFVADESIYRKRMEYELDIIIRCGFVDYMLIVQDIVNWAKSQGILIGFARGSVAGSLIAYFLGITGVDPIRFSLLFERFMNEVRAEFDPPDIDMDFQASRRNEVKEYIIRKYGEENVCSIGAYSRAYASNTIRDVARVMKLSVAELNNIIAYKMAGMTLEEAYEGVDGFRRWVDRDEKHGRCFEIAKQLQGLCRHSTIHPSGILITPSSYVDHIAVQKVKGEICTQWKDTIINKCGLLKLDILGLLTLDILSEILELKGLRLEDIPLGDKRVLEKFTKGETSGIFQFDTYGAKKIIRELEIDRFEDLVLANAINRPIAIRTGTAKSIILRKHGKEEIRYMYDTQDVLEDTYGHIVYQEQVMRLAHRVGNIPLADTEVMRDAIKHFKHDVMASYEMKFIKGAIDNGASEEQARELWTYIQASSGYGFNRSHAVSYALLSYCSMYLKTYYPLEFYTACLRHEAEEGKRRDLELEAIRNGIKILDVDINRSDVNYSIENGCIRKGFLSKKGIGLVASKELKAKQTYASMDDVVTKVEKRKCNKRVLEVLVRNTDVWEECDLCKLGGEKLVMDGRGGANGVMFIYDPYIDTNAKKYFEMVWIRLLNLSGNYCMMPIIRCISAGLKDKENIRLKSLALKNCLYWLLRDIQDIKPKVIVVLGKYPSQSLGGDCGKRWTMVAGDYKCRALGVKSPALILATGKHKEAKVELEKIKKFIDEYIK